MYLCTNSKRNKYVEQEAHIERIDWFLIIGKIWRFSTADRIGNAHACVSLTYYVVVRVRQITSNERNG